MISYSGLQNGGHPPALPPYPNKNSKILKLLRNGYSLGQRQAGISV